jgi:hypothetical protein
MWATQDNRDFIIGVTRTVKTAENQHLFNIVKMDKSGISQSSQYHCGKDATFLIRLVTGLTLGHPTCIGFTRSVDVESARVFDYDTNESDPIRKLTLQRADPISNPVEAYLLKRLSKSFSLVQDSSHQSPALSPGVLPTQISTLMKFFTSVRPTLGGGPLFGQVTSMIITMTNH